MNKAPHSLIRYTAALLLVALAAGPSAAPGRAVTINPDPMSHSPETRNVRKPAVAGSFYPSSPLEIRSMLGAWLHPSDDGGHAAPQAVIVPHAGYVFSGEVAASAYNCIPRGHSFKRIFLLGPSHRVGFAGASVDTLYAYAETPLGCIPIDVAVGKELVDKGRGSFTFRNDAHDREHDLEVQLPFLQLTFGEVPPVVPVVIGTERLGILREIAEVLEPYFNPENLFIISSDFSHYPSYEDAEASDLYLADAICSGGLEAFLKALSHLRKMDYPGQDTAACGACAIAVLLAMMDAQGRDLFSVRHLMYRNSGDSPYGDKDRVVGYNSMLVTRQSDRLFNFSEEERKGMIAAARSSICSSLRLEYDGDAAPVGILKEKGYGVFVTLYLGGRLRGCIGRFTSSDSLYDTIREMARSAAFADPRFPSLSRREAPGVEIEVSVLSPLKKIASVDEFKLGRDGIYMVKGSRHGTFLPQVAEETGWDTEEFLGHCARDKAGIGYEGWKDAELYTYQTEVVKESELR